MLETKNTRCRSRLTKAAPTDSSGLDRTSNRLRKPGADLRPNNPQIRKSTIPQRRPACWCDVWWFHLHAMVIEYLPCIGTVRNMNVIMRIWLPHSGHRSGNTSSTRAISTAHRECAFEGLGGIRSAGSGWFGIALPGGETPCTRAPVAPWPVASVRTKLLRQPLAASSMPAHRSIDGDACDSVAPRRQCA